MFSVTYETEAHLSIELVIHNSTTRWQGECYRGPSYNGHVANTYIFGVSEQGGGPVSHTLVPCEVLAEAEEMFEHRAFNTT
jgi:hypothetical protein